MHKILLPIFLILAVLVLSLPSKTIYVDPLLSADCIGTYSIANRNSSGSDGDAYTTPQKAADVSNPGDIILLRAGTYIIANGAQREAPLDIRRSGTLAAPITYRNYGNETVILSGENAAGVPNGWHALRLGIAPSSQQDSSGQGVQNIIIEGLIVEDATDVGLSINGPADHFNPVVNPTENITIRRVIARNNRSTANANGGGIRSRGRVNNVLIEYCEAYNNTGTGMGFGRIDKNWHLPEAETNMSAAHDSVIRHCLAYNNIHPTDPGNSDGIFLSHAYNCRLENNVSFGNSDDGMDCYASINSTIVSNLLFGHDYTGGNNSGLKF